MKMKNLSLKILLLFLLFASAASAKKNKTPQPQRIYIYGMAASFVDSVAYITPIQPLDSAYIGEHGFLKDRTLYSLQLAGYMERIGKQDMTCCVWYETKEAKAQKKYDKLKKRYVKDHDVKLVSLEGSTFAFKAEEYVATEEEKKK